MAEEPLGALLEVAHGLTILSEGFLANRRLLIAAAPMNLRLADLTAPAAYRFGITGELSATTDYSRPHDWAVAFDAAGFEGIRYHVRHDPRGHLAGIACFGRAGRAKRPPQGYSQPLSADVLLAAAPFGIQIAADLP